MKKATPYVLGITFMFLAIFFILVVFRAPSSWGALVAFLVGGTGFLFITAFMQSIMELREDSPILSSKVFHVCVIVICVISLLVAVVWTCFELRVGYVKGDYSDHRCCLCGAPADGGVFIAGRSVKRYYCEHDYEWIKEEVGKRESLPSDSEVWREVKNIISDRLKSPSSAKFCTESQATIKQSGDTWTVSGYVDADNSFGASIRNNFTVVITFTNDTQYTIDRCEITPR